MFFLNLFIYANIWLTFRDGEGKNTWKVFHKLNGMYFYIKNQFDEYMIIIIIINNWWWVPSIYIYTHTLSLTSLLLLHLMNMWFLFVILVYVQVYRIVHNSHNETLFTAITTFSLSEACLLCALFLTNLDFVCIVVMLMSHNNSIIYFWFIRSMAFWIHNSNPNFWTFDIAMVNAKCSIQLNFIYFVFIKE